MGRASNYSVSQCKWYSLRFALGSPSTGAIFSSKIAVFLCFVIGKHFTSRKRSLQAHHFGALFHSSLAVIDIFFSLTDGGWSKWSSWRSCSATCGGGFQMRTRSCDAPKPKYGGAQCKGSYYQTISCNTEDCPGNGGFLLKVGCPKLLHGC